MAEGTVRAVIVDDEPAARDAVRTLLARQPRVVIVGEAGDGGEAVETVRLLKPDLLFLDIQMPDGDGFSVLEALGSDVPRGVVFVTAHDEYAQRAFEVHALDYVVKPFGRPRFLAAVERALRRLDAEEALDLKETLETLVHGVRRKDGDDVSVVEPAPHPGEGTHPTRLGVRVGHRTTLVDTGDIDWVEADGELVKVHVGDKVHLVSGRMRDFENLLGTTRFFRIHRSTIVNLGRVNVLDADGDGGGSVVLSTGVQLRVARGRWADLQEALGLDFKG